jgi:hypothetical protein
MVIKASTAGKVQQLIEALGGDDDVRREGAIAQLTVIGPRAVERLIAAYDGSKDQRTKIAILHVLECIGDRRTLGPARAALDQGGDLAVGAASALRGLLDSRLGVATESLDALISVVLDRAANRRVRLAAYDALQGMPEQVRAPILAALGADPDRAIRTRAAGGHADPAMADAVWQDALDGRLPDRPSMLRDLVGTHGPHAAFGALQKMIDLVRTSEAATRSAADRANWRALRGALHQTLAFRGSRVAMYDLRESLNDARQPLDASFLAAVHAVGDVSCLEPLATAYAQADPAADRWRHDLVAAFRAISKRERITRRHAVMKRIAARWPTGARDLTGGGSPRA